MELDQKTVQRLHDTAHLIMEKTCVIREISDMRKSLQKVDNELNTHLYIVLEVGDNKIRLGATEVAELISLLDNFQYRTQQRINASKYDILSILNRAQHE